MSIDVKNDLAGAGAGTGSTGGGNPPPDTGSQPPAGGAPSTGAPTEGGGAPGSSPAQGGAGPAAGAAAPPPAEYKPNFKFKVMDDEHEIPEWARGGIKDADTEKLARETFEKSLGLDHIKPKHQALQERFQEWDRGLKQLQTWAGPEAKPEEFQQFLDFFKIPKEKVFQYVQSALEYDELDPAAKAQVDAQRQLAQENARLKQQQAGFQRNAVTQRVRELDGAISRPDVAEIAGEFDKRRGQGAFRALVIRQAQSAYQETGTDLSVDEAVRDVMGMLGYEEQEDVPTPGIVAPATQKGLPVLPTVGGAGTSSPVRTEITSMDQLRQASRVARGMT